MLVAATLLGAGCSVLYSPDGFDTPRPSGSESGAADGAPFDAVAPPGEDATPPDVDAAPPVENLAKAEDLAACAESSPYRSKLTSDPAGRTGGGCRVCADNGTGNVFSINQGTTATSIAPGDTFYGEIWAKPTPGSSTFSVFLALRTRSASNAQLELTEGPSVALVANTWTKLPVTFRATMAGARLELYALTDDAGPGDCFVVDDLRVERR